MFPYMDLLTVGWRYDPIFLSEQYTKEYHVNAFIWVKRYGHLEIK